MILGKLNIWADQNLHTSKINTIMRLKIDDVGNIHEWTLPSGIITTERLEVCNAEGNSFNFFLEP